MHQYIIFFKQLGSATEIAVDINDFGRPDTFQKRIAYVLDLLLKLVSKQNIVSIVSMSPEK